MIYEKTSTIHVPRSTVFRIKCLFGGIGLAEVAKTSRETGGDSAILIDQEQKVKSKYVYIRNSMHRTQTNKQMNTANVK